MSLMRMAQSAARRFGVNFHQHLPDNHIYVDYPVSWHPRYGYKVPPPPGISKLIDDSAPDFARLLAGAAERTDLIFHHRCGCAAGPRFALLGQQVVRAAGCLRADAHPSE